MRTKSVPFPFGQDAFRVVFIYGVIIILTFLILSILLALLRYNVLKALETLTTTAFRSSFGFQECIKKTIPLIFTSYAFTIPFTMTFFNIGGWGQMLVEGAMTAIVGLSLALAGLPNYIMIPLVLAAGILAGGILGWVAGWLKANHDIIPIVSTIMLNRNKLAIWKPCKPLIIAMGIIDIAKHLIINNFLNLIISPLDSYDYPD